VVAAAVVPWLRELLEGPLPARRRFGPASLVLPETGGVAPTGAHVEDTYELNDQSRDGDLDMVLQFRVAPSGLTPASTQACVKGTFVGAGNQAFKFIGKQDFHHHKGELHYFKQGSHITVEGDTNGDGHADFQIQVNGVGKLGAGDFIL